MGLGFRVFIFFSFLAVWNFANFQSKKVLRNILSQFLCFCLNIFQIFEGRIFVGELRPCLYLAHFSCGTIFLPTFYIFNSFKTIFFMDSKYCLGLLRMMLINSSKCCGKKCNLSLASMPSSLLKFCTRTLLASWPLESHCMKELVVEGLRLCIRRGPKLALENPMI